MCNQCDSRKYQALDSLKDLHKPVQGPYDNLVCEECSHMDIDIDFHVEYPCPTIKALNGETEYPKGPIPRPEEEQWNG